MDQNLREKRLAKSVVHVTFPTSLESDVVNKRLVGGELLGHREHRMAEVSITQWSECSG
jgi:hypothetical protein